MKNSKLGGILALCKSYIYEGICTVDEVTDSQTCEAVNESGVELMSVIIRRFAS